MFTLRNIVLLSILAISMGEMLSSFSTEDFHGLRGSQQRVSRNLRKSAMDSSSHGEVQERYPSPTGRGSGWRFDLGQVNSQPAFVAAPPAPGFGRTGLRSMSASGSVSDLRSASSVHV
eukprot:1278324-Rhodomonas_salina.1